MPSLFEDEATRQFRAAVASTGKRELSGSELTKLLDHDHAQRLLSSGVISLAGGDDAKRLRQDEERIVETATYVVSFEKMDSRFVLNRRGGDGGDSLKGNRNASDIAIELRKQIMRLYGKFLAADGSGVDYEAAANSQEMKAYEQVAAQLRAIDVVRLESDIPNPDERKALFLNLYNALVIHGHIAIGDPQTPPERTEFFTKTAYDVGGEIWTLDIIEHGFVRCNRKKPFATAPLLDTADPRSRHALAEPVDPRIHFALNCGAKSCPPIRFYAAEKLNEQLTMAAQSFLGDESNLSVNITANSIKLTKLLDWYGFDFGADQTAVLYALLSFLEGDAKSALETVLAKGSPRVEFSTYDWSENHTKSKV